MYLVVNLGLKSIRGIVFDEAGEALYSTAYPVHTSLTKSRVEQDAREWVLLLERILQDIAKQTDLSRQVRFVTATTSSSCIFGIGSDMKPVTPVLMVSDRRAHSISERITADDAFRLRSRELGAACPASALVPKAIWFRENEPKTFRGVRRWIGAGDYLNFYFTGEFIVDPLNAGKSFHNGRDYDRGLLSHVGLDPDTLSRVREIGSVLPIRKEVLSRCGYSRDCRYVVSTYDAICAVFGATVGLSNSACDVSGTVTSVRMLLDHAPTNGSATLLTQEVPSLGKCLLGASNNLGGGIVEWYKQAFFDERDPGVYSIMEDLAASANPGSDGLVFLPYLMGERAPFNEPHATGTFFGIQRTSTRAQFTRAVFESTAYVTRDLVELIRQSGVTVDLLTVSGGLARFDLINQIKADVCNVPVHVLENFESTSIGALVIMLVANGTHRNIDEALSRVIRVRKVINPSARRHEIYRQLFGLYKSVNSSLTSVYHDHAGFKESEAIHLSHEVRNL